MANKVNLIVFPAKDIENTKALFNKFLNEVPYADQPYYVGYRLGDLEIGLDPNTDLGPIAYTNVEDINSSLKDLLDAGTSLQQEVKDVGGGLLIAQVKDTNGNILGLRQPPK